MSSLKKQRHIFLLPFVDHRVSLFFLHFFLIFTHINRFDHIVWLLSLNFLNILFFILLSLSTFFSLSSPNLAGILVYCFLFWRLLNYLLLNIVKNKLTRFVSSQSSPGIPVTNPSAASEISLGSRLRDDGADIRFR